MFFARYLFDHEKVNCSEEPAKHEHLEAKADSFETVLDVDFVAQFYLVFVHSRVIVIVLVFTRQLHLLLNLLNSELVQLRQERIEKRELEHFEEQEDPLKLDKPKNAPEMVRAFQISKHAERQPDEYLNIEFGAPHKPFCRLFKSEFVNSIALLIVRNEELNDDVDEVD